jgi:hypothetical protein
MYKVQLRECLGMQREASFGTLWGMNTTYPSNLSDAGIGGECKNRARTVQREVKNPVQFNNSPPVSH